MVKENDELNILDHSTSYDELQDAFKKVHHESLQLAKKLSVSKQRISNLLKLKLKS